MSVLKRLNFLLIIENALGIYRNYCNENKTKKCFILFQIFVQTMLHSIMVVGQLYFLLIENQPNYILSNFLISGFITALISVVTGINNSQAFLCYIQSMTRVCKRFEKDKKYNKSVKKLYWFSIIFTLLSFAFSAFRTLDLFLHFKPKDHDLFVTLFVPFFISQFFTRFTLLFEKLVMFVLIMIVVNLSECINSLTSSVQDRVEGCDISSDEQCYITREQIQEWVELYQDLANSCNKLSLCFGRQVLI